jgi:hypothetical protein
MKTTDLAVGLLQMFGAAALLFLPYGEVIRESHGRVLMCCLCLAGVVVNGWQGVNRVMEACFGTKGLICELWPIGDDDAEIEAMGSACEPIDVPY